MEDLNLLTRNELNKMAVDNGVPLDKVEAATKKADVISMIEEITKDDAPVEDVEGDVSEDAEDVADEESDEEPEVSTEEENKQASLNAAEQAKANKEKLIESKKNKLRKEMADAASKAAKEKEKRAAGSTKKYKFALNFKCDGLLYRAGKSYQLPAGVAKLAEAAGCLEV
jgi:DNA anti-recombination protein RmuC